MSGQTSSSVVALRITNDIYTQRWCKVSSANGENLVSIYSPPTENAQCLLFCMLWFPKRLLQGDSFCLEWNSGLLYAFLPIPLLPKVLKKIRTDQAQVILVAPDWAGRVWYPELLGMSISPLIRLPLREDLLSQQQERVLLPNLRTRHLHAWRLSSDS